MNFATFRPSLYSVPTTSGAYVSAVIHFARAVESEFNAES
jgi:hypothetical protein